MVNSRHDMNKLAILLRVWRIVRWAGVGARCLIMCFEKIGPYAFSRGDLVAASLAISFVTGAKATRIKTGLIMIVGAVVAIIGAATSDLPMIFMAIGALTGMFVGGPALRSRKRSRNIYLSYDSEGLVAETDNVRTLYKWATIQSYKPIGSRLFIMISDGCALVIANRFTNAANMKKLIETLQSRHAE